MGKRKRRMGEEECSREFGVDRGSELPPEVLEHEEGDAGDGGGEEDLPHKVPRHQELHVCVV